MSHLTKKIFLTVILSVLTSFCLCLTSSQGVFAQAKKPIKVGYVDTMSGPFGSSGTEGLKGFKMAAEEINAMGGILGRAIEVLVEDDEVKTEIAARKARKLILENKVELLHGVSTTGGTLALNEIATQYKVLHINSEADGVATLKGMSPYNLNTGLYTHEAGLAMVLALMEKYPRKDIKRWFMWLEDTAFGHELTDAVKEAVKKYLPEAEIVGEDVHPLGEKDFSTRISKALATNPQVMCNTDWLADVATFVRQAKPYGFFEKVPIFLSGGYSTDTMTTLGKEMVPCDALVFSCNPFIPENQDFFNKFVKRYNDIPKFEYVGGYYDALYLYKTGVERSKSFDPLKITKALANSKVKLPATGEITITKFHTTVVNWVGVASFKYDERWGVYTPRDLVKVPGQKLELTSQDAIRYGCKWCETVK